MNGADHFDAVVVGSGFGGGVMACRLAEAGLSVCVLERGKPYPPGTFPRRPREMSENFWDPSRGMFGLFNVWSFRGLEALISSGLGGGSLIYANVMIRKDERWFVKDGGRGDGYEHWPVDRADLDPHYDRVEDVLTPTPYPLQVSPYSETTKTTAFRDAARHLGLDWSLPKLAISFGNEGSPPRPGVPLVEEVPNLHGVPRYGCMLSGECDVGCNYGSKNTIDLTYLSRARHAGAEIRTLAEVRRFEPGPDRGFTIAYRAHRPGEDGPPREVTVTARRLILSAGALGTPFLLLKNHSNFPKISRQLGTRFCGNGDLLTFAVRAVERDGRPRPIEASYGPVITSAIRLADALDGGSGRGFYVEDAGWPAFVAWMLEAYDVPTSGRRALSLARRRLWARLTRSPKSDLSAEIGWLIGRCRLSGSSLPMLGMGRDLPDGRMRLRGGYLDVGWTTHTSREYFERVRRTMEELARALGADFLDNPLWYLKRVITVHPLGGCPMGRDEREGVVDSYGQVFNHPGLYIADGSVMPGPVGPNPAFTIAALADRFADRIIETKG